MSLLHRHRLCSTWCVCVCCCMCVCIGTGVGLWSRQLNMGRSSSIQPRQVSHHSHQHHKKHFTIWCFQSTTRDNIFNWQQNCLDAICVCTSEGWGWGCGWVCLCVCVYVHLCMDACVCVCVPAVGSSCLCSGLACCQAWALAMRVQFLGHSLFAVYLEKHKSAMA